MINIKLQDKFSNAYENLKPSPIIYMEGSEEYWKPITQNHVPGVREGAYEISTHGNIRSKYKVCV